MPDSSLQAFVISSDRSPLLALAATLHLPREACDVGVVIVTGGYQTRAGSHRQFLKLARRFSSEAFPCLRFDLPGLGDSTGDVSMFDHNAVAIRAAVDALIDKAPVVKKVVLWGLCDGATAAALYARDDPRVAGLVLVNPWIKTERLQAKVMIKSYYCERLMSLVFWKKLLSGRVGALHSATEWFQSLRTANGAPSSDEAWVEHTLQSLEAWTGKIAIVIAARDLTGQAFLQASAGRLPESVFNIVEGADHTFSSVIWHQQMETLSLRALHQ